MKQRYAAGLADDAFVGLYGMEWGVTTNADNCSDSNVASTDYSPRWKSALNLGFHLGPVADHDSHCNNYGQGIPNRTVYLIPNGASPVLTKSKLLQAHKARHFYATEDSNAQLVFTTGDGSRVMGDVFSAAGSAALRAAVYDPGAESVSTLEIWRGQIGGGVPASPLQSVSNQSTLTITQNLTSGTFYYYVHAVQADGHDLWSAPMWITYGPAGGGSISIANWRLAQVSAAFDFIFPAGTTIPDNGYLVLGRDATKAAFEAFWGALPANAVYVNSAGALPVINGDEAYDLYNASGTKVDGRTIKMTSGGGSSVKRKDPCNSPSASASWTVTASSTGTPGSGAGAGCSKGVVINELSDATGTGNFIYEFVELHYDK